MRAVEGRRNRVGRPAAWLPAPGAPRPARLPYARGPRPGSAPPLARGPRLRLRSPKDEAAPGLRSVGRPKGITPSAAPATEPGVRTPQGCECAPDPEARTLRPILGERRGARAGTRGGDSVRGSRTPSPGVGRRNGDTASTHPSPAGKVRSLLPPILSGVTYSSLGKEDILPRQVQG